MTLEQKREAALTEALSSLKEIATQSKTLEEAQWLAACTLWVARYICAKASVPTKEETLAWVGQHIEQQMAPEPETITVN